MTTSGLIRIGSRPASLVVVLAALAALAPARAADLSAAARDDLQRALALVGPSTSEEPALRQERQAREPSPGFLLGAALGAWINAAGQLDFDSANPAAAGRPHVSQIGGDPDAFAQDCADEMTAFTHLEIRSQALGLTADRIVAAVPVGGGVLAEWRARKSAVPTACR
jgi:hypothetical protein